MPVEDVFNPTTRSITNPSAIKDNMHEADESSYWDKKRKSARAQREFEEEERIARQARDAENSPPDAPFQVKGSVNLGNFDVQQQQEEMKATLLQIQDKAKDEISALRTSNEGFREKVHEIQLKSVEDSLRVQIEMLTKAVNDASTTGNKGSLNGITGVIDEVAQIAGALGYQKAGESPNDPPQIRLALMKMEMESAAAQRRFEWEMEVSKRNWQLELQKLENERHAAAATIQQEKEKRSQWASPFESLGMAIAKGLLDSGSGPTESIAGQPKKKRRGDTHIQAGDGESGELECPDCKQPIAIAPSARTAVCPSCDASFTIERVPSV